MRVGSNGEILVEMEEGYGGKRGDKGKDEITTMEFVVSVLVDIFHKDQVSAEAIMMGVHKKGQAVVGKYPYDIAVTRVSMALKRAKEAGYPFRMTVEEA